MDIQVLVKCRVVRARRINRYRLQEAPVMVICNLFHYIVALR